MKYTLKNGSITIDLSKWALRSFERGYGYNAYSFDGLHSIKIKCRLTEKTVFPQMDIEFFNEDAIELINIYQAIEAGRLHE